MNPSQKLLLLQLLIVFLDRCKHLEKGHQVCNPLTSSTDLMALTKGQ